MDTQVSSGWRLMFRAKGVWNCTASIGFLLGDDRLRDWLQTPHPEPYYRALFLALAFIFGFGYWWAGGDTRKNRNIIRMGVMGQVSVFVILAYAVIFAQLPWPLLLPGIVDLAFAVAFVVFLLTHPADV